MNARPLIAGLALATLATAGIAIAQQRAPDQSSGALPAAPPAHEARTVAKLKVPVGTVLVSRGDALVAGVKDQRVPLGTRVVTTAGATVTIDYDRGCDVKMSENQRFTVREGECAARIAALENVTPATAAAGGRNVAGLAGLGLIGAAAAIVAATDRGPNTPASPATIE